MNSNNHPMVAIRTQSLNLDCVVGVTSSDSSAIHPLVTKEYIQLLLQVCNERFVENKKKMDKLSGDLEKVLFPAPAEPSNWEDAEARKLRKREEGLARADEVRRSKEEARRLKAEQQAAEGE